MTAGGSLARVSGTAGRKRRQHTGFRRAVRVVCVVMAVSIPHPSRAVQPDEILADPALETRARALSEVLRCPVCQGESIDDSNAPVARDLRLLVRERLLAGDSDQAVLDYITARYGEYVLFNPTVSGVNLVLWLAGPAMLLGGLAIGLGHARRRSVAELRAASGGADAAGTAALTDTEKARLAAILRD